ncbi:SpoIIE family protein phosphatase [Puniceicoccus vermicola]|uniref:PP2C family protein-serine/threonine phosphatase n=1 Tax=Puniceicoccus vermicola TaxID=388746 RepID=A0A7X1AX11_9BACT|nr:PP2C family protein-serine/threonine phosphatase [Puniceicoccus vermicola]
MVGFIAGLFVGAVCAWVVVQYFRQNMRLMNEEKQRLEQERTLVLEFMHNLVEGVGEDSPRVDLYRRIVHAAILGTGAVSGALFVPDERKKLHSVAIEGVFPPQRPLPPGTEEKLATRAEFIRKTLESEEIAFGEGVIGQVASEGKEIVVNQPDSDDRVAHHRDPVLRIRALLAVPMYFRKRFLGVVAVANPSDGMGFTDTDVSMVSSLAEQAALAIHNADQVHLQMERQRLDLDLSLAANIQGMLLPNKLPEVKRLELAAMYQTAQQVGGDMYNVIELPLGKIGVAIADVSGKGIAASLLMAICQTALEHLARDGKGPAQVLSGMNEEIIDEIRADMFVTMIYAVIDPVEQTVQLARAGHELPVLLSVPSGNSALTCRTISSEGMALGMVPSDIFDAVIEEVTVPFHPGDVLALYTDGITERINEDGVEYATSRLMDVVRHEHRKGAEAIQSALLASVESFAGAAAPADDMTLMILKGREPVENSKSSA